jgi:hypothetical protein
MGDLLVRRYNFCRPGRRRLRFRLTMQGVGRASIVELSGDVTAWQVLHPLPSLIRRENPWDS